MLRGPVHLPLPGLQDASQRLLSVPFQLLIIFSYVLLYPYIIRSIPCVTDH
jgi:hypothetical protein